MISLTQAFGFRVDRTQGSHHILIHPNGPRPLNLQKVNGQAKPYQIQQFLKAVEQYNLKMET